MITKRSVALTSVGASAAAALIAIGLAAGAGLPRVASEQEHLALNAVSRVGAGTCIYRPSRTSCAAPAVSGQTGRNFRKLRASVERFSSCMATRGAPVGKPLFSFTGGGVSVSFPAYDIHRLRFRTAYFSCKRWLIRSP